MSSSASDTYIGGLNIPMRGGAGRVNLDRPLARLELHPRRVSLLPRGPLKFLIPSRSIPLGAIREAFPIAPAFLSGPGVGMSCAEGDYYFWTPRAHEILHALESAGIPIDPDPRHIRLRWLTS